MKTEMDLKFTAADRCAAISFLHLSLASEWIWRDNFGLLRLQNWLKVKCDGVCCFARKSQNLKGALRERVAFKHNMLWRREMMALNKSAESLPQQFLGLVSSESRTASSVSRDKPCRLECLWQKGCSSGQHSPGSEQGKTCLRRKGQMGKA